MPPTTLRTSKDCPASVTSPVVRPSRAEPHVIYGIEIDTDRAWKQDYPGEVKVLLVLMGGKSIRVTLHPSVAAELGAALTVAADLAATPEEDDQ